MKNSIKTGDMVKVIAGDNKGKIAKVVKLDPKAGKAFLEGIEVRERHLRATQFNPKGGKKTVHLGIDLSNLKKEEGKK